MLILRSSCDESANQKLIWFLYQFGLSSQPQNLKWFGVMFGIVCLNYSYFTISNVLPLVAFSSSAHSIALSNVIKLLVSV